MRVVPVLGQKKIGEDKKLKIKKSRLVFTLEDFAIPEGYEYGTYLTNLDRYRYRPHWRKTLLYKIMVFMILIILLNSFFLADESLYKHLHYRYGT